MEPGLNTQTWSRKHFYLLLRALGPAKAMATRKVMSQSCLDEEENIEDDPMECMEKHF